MLKIGKIVLKHGLMLAPMAGVTDYVFRELCRRYGAEYEVTEMVSAKAVMFEDKKTFVLADVERDSGPSAIQIFGSEPEIMSEAAKRLLEANPSTVAIDINMGCPVGKIVSNGEGSALMRSPELGARIVSAVKKAVSIPVTVKIRSGIDESSLNAVEVAKRVEDAGADLICVHGRTRKQMYQPPVDRAIIAEVKKSVSIPVVGNGGINSAADAIQMYRDTGCDGIMIARGACGNPFIFSEIKAALESQKYEKPSIRQRLEIAAAQLEMMIEDKGTIGLFEARKHLGWYLHGIAGAAAVRDRINRCEDPDEIKRMLFSLC